MKKTEVNKISIIAFIFFICLLVGSLVYNGLTSDPLEYIEVEIDENEDFNIENNSTENATNYFVND